MAAAPARPLRPRLPSPSTSAGSPAVTAPFSSRAQLSAIGYDALAVVALDAGEIHVGDAHQFGARCRSAAGTASTRPRAARRCVSRLSAAIWLRMTSVSISAICRPAIPSRTTRMVGDVGLADRAHQHRLPGLDVGQPQRVAALAGDRVPRAVAELEPLPVLGELDARANDTRDGSCATKAST